MGKGNTPEWVSLSGRVVFDGRLQLRDGNDGGESGLTTTMANSASESGSSKGREFHGARHTRRDPILWRKCLYRHLEREEESWRLRVGGDSGKVGPGLSGCPRCPLITIRVYRKVCAMWDQESVRV